LVAASMSLQIPIPTSFLAAVWFGMGLTFGRGFGKNLDQTIKKTERFFRLPTWQQWLLSRVLDVTHHWWIGALLMIYISAPEVFWFGAGLLVDDLPDVPRRIRSIFQQFNSSFNGK
jgi:hypothetical protein